MPVFQYKAFDHNGKETTGIVDASTPREAREKLRGRNVFVTDMTPMKAAGRAPKTGKNAMTKAAADVGLADAVEEQGLVESAGLRQQLESMFAGRARDELVSTTRLLATLLKAGIPLVGSLTSVIQQVEDKYLGTVMRQIRESVQGGVSFADALAMHPALFDALYVNMIRAGEAAGALDQVLKRLADFMQAQKRMKNRVSAALTYPIIMMVMGLGVVCFLLGYVVPKIVAVVTKRGTPLPLPTKILLTIQEAFMSWWWVGLGGAILAWLAYSVVVRTEKGAMFRDTWKLRLPIVGDLFRKQSVARFATTFATLLRSGVQATDCLKILANVVDNKLLGKVLVEVRERIIEGTDIATPIKRSRVFPPVVGDMIAVGEESGQLEELLERIAETYDEEVDITSQKVTAMIEPLIIVLMAAIVGFIVLAVVLPLVQGFKF
ncbi:MAG: type II secretion system F family protein [Planctomycetes bacterium]|nr:type II secretion system F family protein [Planctomycetota bacterium]MCW8137830.1 type II secretion system F family protein [Planctomycetota bacterium]